MLDTRLTREVLNSPRLGWEPLTSIVNPQDYFQNFWTVEAHGTADMTDDGAGLISAWVDAITDVTVTAATTARPTYVDSDHATFPYPALQFDGVANCFVTTTLTNVPTGATPGEIGAIVRPVAGTAVIGGICQYGGTANDTYRYIRRSGADALTVTEGTASASPSSTPLSVPSVCIGAWNSTDQFGYLNGNPFGSNPTTVPTLNTSTTRLRIGANNSTAAGQFWSGSIAMVWLTKQITSGIVLPGRSTTLREDMEGWAAWKYPRSGIRRRLPTYHPWKWRPII